MTGGTVNLSWAAATDNVGVTRYNVHRGTTSGFTPWAANRIAQPTGLNYADTGLATGSYFYKVTAEDAAGNIGPASNEATATVADGTAPTAPSGLAASVTGSTVNLSWTAATDNVGVTRYNLHRGTTSGFTPSTANRIAQPTGLSFADRTCLPAPTSTRSPPRTPPATSAPSRTPPAAPCSTRRRRRSRSRPGVGGDGLGHDDSHGERLRQRVGRRGAVQARRCEPGRRRYGRALLHFLGHVASSNGPHNLSAVARDGGGNTTTATTVPVTVQNTASAGLVGAWAFDEASGATAADQSGKGNNGTQTNATWITGGKFNNTLSFNGTNAWVTVPDAATLDLTTGMTVEAWVRPGTTGNWRTAVVKEQPGNLVYGIYANTSANRPEAEVFVGGSTRSIVGPSALPTGSWSHLAATYDGTTLRLYVNGAEVAQLAVSGSILTSNSPVRIGGNQAWGGEWFNGSIDEVRIYNRGLTPAEIQADMDRSVTPDTTRPTVTARAPAPGAAGVNVGASITATFSEPMNAGSITSATFQLKDATAAVVPATVSYDAASNTAT